MPLDHPLNEFTNRKSATIAEACTSCGACVEICPVIPHAGLSAADAPAVLGGILKTLRDGTALDGAAAEWAHQCDGCGKCIPACPEGINPRTMLMLANTKSAEQHSETPVLFRKMARAIRLMAAMQLAPADYRQLLQPPAVRDVPVIFYVGCNAVRTPHLLFNAMYVLDALGVDYDVMGGPAACCGIIHTKWQGDVATGGKVTDGTVQNFGGRNPEKVLSWCPSCQLHLGETLSDYQETSFDFDHVTKYLVEREDELDQLFTTPVPLRVLLHAHEGMADLGENVARILKRVPGLEVAGIAWESGYTCGGSGADRSPGLKAIKRAETIEQAKAPDVDALVSLYHGCHAQLVSLSESENIEVMNFTDLLVRALGGTPREDVLEAGRMLKDWHAMAAGVQSTLAENGTEVDTDWLADLMPELFTNAEFKGGLEAFD